MNKITLGLVVLTLIGCKSASYFQVYEFEPVNTKYDEHGFMVHENDSVKVTYSFWSQNGTVAFNLFNKLDVPIYIDWKKSSVIFNGRKESYWKDEMYSTSSSVGKVMNMKPGINPYLLFESFGYSYNTATMYKPEPVSFIPPHSYITVSKFPLGYSYPFNKNDISLDNKEVICKRDFTEKNSSFNIRNYISFSTTEKFDKSSSLDDFFYLKSVKELPFNKDISELAKPSFYYSKLKNKSIDMSKHTNYDDVYK